MATKLRTKTVSPTQEAHNDSTIKTLPLFQHITQGQAQATMMQTKVWETNLVFLNLLTHLAGV